MKKILFKILRDILIFSFKKIELYKKINYKLKRDLSKIMNNPNFNSRKKFTKTKEYKEAIFKIRILISVP
jgi:hypothetical protein